MENPTESEELYDKNYYLSFHDGSLTKKILTFSSYINRNSLDEDEIDRRISETLYNYPTSKKPTYYQENPKLFSSYMHSSLGIKNIEIIKNELFICFKKLINWSKENNLKVLDENQKTVGVDSRFSIFFNRIKKNEFSDKTYLFYAEGKKAIEIIALLIEDNSIAKDYRTNQLISLTLNGNLHYCVEGCFTRFMSTAQYLKNYLSFNFPYILTKLIIDISEEISSSKHSPGAKIYTEILCEKAKVSLRDYEIHAKNYLTNNLLKELGLTKITVNDFYTHVFDTSDIKELYNYFISIFKSKFTSIAIVKFLQNEYFKKESIHFNDGLSNIINIQELEEFLTLFGQDNDFKLDEIITLDVNEKPKFKIENPLLITISERLINTEWFKFGFYSRWMDKYGSLLKPLQGFNVQVNMPIFNEKDRFRIFIGNYELSWFKLNNERHRMIDLIKSEGNVDDLLEVKIPSNMVQYLFENSEDLLNFFKILPKNKHASYLSYLEKNNFNFKMHILSKSLLNDQVRPIKLQLNQYDLLIYFNKLFSNINKEDLNNFSTRFQISDLIQSVMNYNIRYFDTVNTYFVASFLRFFKFSNLIGNKKYSNLNFDLNTILANDVFKLDDQFFLDTTFDNVQFNIFLSKIKFIKSNLNNVYFKNKINAIEFYNCKVNANFFRIDNSLISQVKGELDIFQCNDLKINKFFGDLNFINYAEGLEIGLSSGKKITICNIKDSFLFNVKFNQFIINGEISNTYFTMMDFSNTRFIQFEDIKDRIVDDLFTGNFNFRISEADKHKMFFLKSRFSTQSLIDFLRYPAIRLLNYDLLFLFRGTDLRLIDFNNLEISNLLKRYKKIDFSHCNLEEVNIKNLFNSAEITLKHAKLKNAIFLDANTFNTNFENADLSHCDLSKANLLGSRFASSKIDNVKLTIDQLFHFYKFGHYDFNSIHLVGIYNFKINQALDGVRLSNQALDYLILSGYKNFRRFDLRFISKRLETLFQSRTDLNLEGAIFDKELSISECINLRKIAKRSVNCLSSLEDINYVFKELVFRDKQRYFINSEKWLNEYRKNDYSKKEQLIKITKLISLSGDHKSIVKELVHYEGLKLFLKKTAHTINQINIGILGTETVFDFIEGNYDKVLINLSFISSGPILSKVAKKIIKLSDYNLLKNRYFISNALRMSARFLSKATSAFIVYDLVKEIKEMNASDIHSLLRIIDDNIYLTIDASELGLETAEMLGYVEEGISSTFGIAGSFVATIIFISTNIYETVDFTNKLNKCITLTSAERIYEGIRVFFGIGIDDQLKKEIEKKQINNYLVLKALAFIKESSLIQNYFFSTVDKNTDFINNTIILSTKLKVGFNRDEPDVPPDGILTCYNFEINTNANMRYYCSNTIGISDIKPKHENLTLINVGKGNDIVAGFLNSPNMIVTQAGYKLIKGGNKQDIFILVNDGITGSFDGLNDIDTLDLREFVPELDILEINFLNNYLIKNTTISFFSIEKLLGRLSKADNIFASCETVAIDSNGGNVKFRDYIVFKPQNCMYSTFIKISDFTSVKNQADFGNFTYFISRNNEGSDIKLLNKANQQFFFNNSLSELNEIQFISEEKNFRQVILYFRKDKTESVGNSFNQLSFIVIKFYLNSVKFYLNDKSEIKITKSNFFIYVRETFFSSIHRALENYLNIANWLRASIIVNSNSSLFFISNNNNEILENNPDLTSYLVSLGKQNIFKIFISKGFLDTSPIFIHNLHNISSEDILDLREIMKTIKNNLNCDISLNVQDKHADLELIINLDKECGSSHQPLLKITLVGAINKWYSKINIIKHTLFLKISKTKLPTGKFSWFITPNPIKINETQKILIISDEDIEPNTSIKLPTSIVNLSPVKIGNNDLDLALISTEKKFYALVFLKFYNIKSQNKYFNLSIQHNEEKIYLRNYINISLNSLPCLNNLTNKIDNRISEILTSTRKKRQISYLNYLPINNRRNRKNTNNFFSIPSHNKRKLFKINSHEVEPLSIYNDRIITIDIFIPISAFFYGSFSSILDEIYNNIKEKSNCIELIYLFIIKPILYLSHIINDDKYLNLFIYLILHFSFFPLPNFRCESFIGTCTYKFINFLLPIFLYLFSFSPLLIFYENGFTDFCFLFLNLLNYSIIFKSGEFITTNLINTAKKSLNSFDFFKETQDNSSNFFFRRKVNEEQNIDLPVNDHNRHDGCKKIFKLKL